LRACCDQQLKQRQLCCDNPKGFPMLHRKTFILTLAAGLFALASAAQALTVKPYSAAELAAAQAAGTPVAVAFHADWCPTCKAQGKVFDGFKTDAALNKVMVLLADYDNEKDLKKEMKVRTQSTIVVFKGKTEVARSAGVTNAADLKTTLSSGL
jgi:thiol:disulfide interchange protein